jgi:endonuclease-3
METNQKNRILAFLDKTYPLAGCELWYRKDYHLLIAVVLSAQTTDMSVNQVTPVLFKKFPRLEDLANADIQDIETVIQSIGLFHTKAKHIQAIAQILIEKHGGKVPSDKQALMQLPGVGIKTANVVRAEWFHIPEIAVDTHVHRISRRLGFIKTNDDVTITEKKLRLAIPMERYIKLHHQFIHFGRYHCKAKKPNCLHCPLRDLCKEPNKNLKE